MILSRRVFLTSFLRGVLGLTLIKSITLAGTETPKPRRHSSVCTDLQRLLACIAAVESGNRDWLVGSRGELSKYQIKHSTWNDIHKRSKFVLQPFKTHCHGLYAQIIAEVHLDWINHNLIFSTPWKLACAWKTGLTIADWGGGTPLDYERATRITNLYFSDYSTQQISDSHS